MSRDFTITGINGIGSPMIPDEESPITSRTLGGKPMSWNLMHVASARSVGSLRFDVDHRRG